MRKRHQQSACWSLLLPDHTVSVLPLKKSDAVAQRCTLALFPRPCVRCPAPKKKKRKKVENITILNPVRKSSIFNAFVLYICKCLPQYLEILTAHLTLDHGVPAAATLLTGAQTDGGVSSCTHWCVRNLPSLPQWGWAWLEQPVSGAVSNHVRLAQGTAGHQYHYFLGNRMKWFSRIVV